MDFREIMNGKEAGLQKAIRLEASTIGAVQCFR